MSHFAHDRPFWWNSNEQQIAHSLSKNLNLKVESSQFCRDLEHEGVQMQDLNSSSTQSTSLSNNEVAAMAGSGSPDQCISSEAGQDEAYLKQVESQMKPNFLMRNPSLAPNHPQVDYVHSLPFTDPQFGGLIAAYGPQAIIQHQMMRMPPARVPLPFDVAEDAPIFVNAKQYHGILRRRQSRAKLEAQNKVAKTRKPYLHESRHLHALNRVRGSGGRFIGKKKLKQPDQGPVSFPNSIHNHSNADSSNFSFLNNCEAPAASCSDVSGDVIFRLPENGFSGNFYNSGNQHHTPVVR